MVLSSVVSHQSLRSLLVERAVGMAFTDTSLALHYITVINVFKEKTSVTLQELNAIEKMSFQSTSTKTGSDVADLIS